VGVPQVHHFGQEGLHNVLVIDLLGPNLEDLFDMCARKFTIKTVCMAAKQMVSDLDIVMYFYVCARMSKCTCHGVVIGLSGS
jgi:casein kinase 1